MRPSSSARLSDWLYSRYSSPSSMPASDWVTSPPTRSGSMPVRSKNNASVTARSVMRYSFTNGANMASGTREGKARSASERDLAPPLRRLVAIGWEGVDPVVVYASLGVACGPLALADRLFTEAERGQRVPGQEPDRAELPCMTSSDEMIQAHDLVARLVTKKASARALVAAGFYATVVSELAQAAEPRPWQLGFQPAATPVQARI